MFLDEIAARLVAQGVGVLSSNIILGSKGRIPVGDGPYISLLETGGSAPLRVHNQPGVLVQKPSGQVVVRAKSYKDARTVAKAVYLAIDGVWNTSLSGVMYYSLKAVQEPTDIGLDSVDRPMISFNFEAEKAPS